MNKLIKTLALVSVFAIPFVGHAQIVPLNNLGPISGTSVTPHASVVNVPTSSISAGTLPISHAQISATSNVNTNSSHVSATLTSISPSSAIHTAQIATQTSTNPYANLSAIPASSIPAANLHAVSTGTQNQNNLPGTQTGGLTAINSHGLSLGSIASSSNNSSNNSSNGSSNNSSGNGAGSNYGGSNYSSGGTTSFYGYAYTPAAQASQTPAAVRYAYAQSGVVHDVPAENSQTIQTVSSDSPSQSSNDTFDSSRNTISGQASVAGLGFIPKTLAGWLAVILTIIALAVAVREYRISIAKKNWEDSNTANTENTANLAEAFQISQEPEERYAVYVPRPITA